MKLFFVFTLGAGLVPLQAKNNFEFLNKLSAWNNTLEVAVGSRKNPPRIVQATEVKGDGGKYSQDVNIQDVPQLLFRKKNAPGIVYVYEFAQQPEAAFNKIYVRLVEDKKGIIRLEPQTQGFGIVPMGGNVSTDNISLIKSGSPQGEGEQGPNMRLLAAIRGGSVEGVQNALSSGANPHASIEGEEWNTPLLLAVHHMLASEFKKDKSGHIALAGGTPAGKWAIVKSLIKAGADVNAQNRDGYTPLMLAARTDNTSLAETLLSAGAKPAMKNNKGETALSIAKSKAVDRGMIDLLSKKASQK